MQKLSIIDGYVVKQTALIWLSVLIILFLIMISGLVGDYLTKMTAGNMPADLILSIVGLRSVRALTLLLPVSLFIAEILLISRLYEENEMAVMRACGYGQHRLLRPLLWLGVPIFIGLLFCSLWLSPKASEQYYLLRYQALNSIQLSGLLSGKFQSLPSDEKTFYVESVETGSQIMKNVYLFSEDAHQDFVLTAEKGELFLNGNNQRELMLTNGEYINFDETETHRLSFEKNALKIATPELKTGKHKLDTWPTLSLIQDPNKKKLAEFHWRIALPFTILILTIIAVPLAKSSPRQGKYSKLVLGLIIYVLYFNLINIAKFWVFDTVIFFNGIWLVHLIFFTLGLLWLRTPRLKKSAINADEN